MVFFFVIERNKQNLFNNDCLGIGLLGEVYSQAVVCELY